MRAKIVLAAALAVSALLVAAAWAVGAQDVTGAPPVEAPQSASPAQAQPAASLPGAAVYRQSVRVWVRSNGVGPRIAHATAGPAVIRVENGTGLPLTLKVERVLVGQGGHELTRELVARVELGADARRDRRDAVLVPGEYVFYDEARPQFTGRLVVEPPGR
jgi:hypothetical protein